MRIDRMKTLGTTLCAIFLVLVGVYLIERAIRMDLGDLGFGTDVKIDPDASVRQVEYGKLGSDPYVLVEFETGERVFYFCRTAVRLNDREP